LLAPAHRDGNVTTTRAFIPQITKPIQFDFESFALSLQCETTVWHSARRNPFQAASTWSRKGHSLSHPEFHGRTEEKRRSRRAGNEHGATPSSPPDFTRDQEMHALRDMLLIRRFEEKAGQLYGMGAIGGFCHLYIGQEAIVVGMQMALKDGDQVITGYRDHGHMLACGMDAKGVMAELTGRKGGYSKGKGGSMHMFSREKNFYGGHGIVGAQVSLGTGLAFANRYRGNDLVSLAYFGDGASNQGQVYESFNMAELWKLPVIYIIENNRYAMGTSVTRSSAQTDFSKRGISFNIPGEQVDGMDVRAVKAAGDRAVAWCRAGKGPFILEMQTYRYRGHSMSDPAKYRTREEVDKVRHDQDPIEQVRNRLLAADVTEQDLKAIDAEVRDIVNASADFAQQDPEPDASELYTDVYR
jgi:pyruvate dehydrogenase E1 component alpha subunit